MANHLKWSLTATLLVALLVTLPSSNLTGLDGLPLSPKQLICLAVLLTIIWGTKWSTIRPKLWITILVALIGWQLVGYLLFPTGWSICLRREIQTEQLTTPCEPSAQFISGQRSYVWPKINIQNNQFPLHFFNQREFNFPSGSSYERSQLPYSFQATTFFLPKHDTSVTVSTNTPNTYVNLDGTKNDILPDHPITLALSAHNQYQLNIGFTSPNDEANSISVLTDSQSFYAIPPISSKILTLLYQTIFWTLTSGLIILSTFAVIQEYLSQNQITRHLLLLILLIPGCTALATDLPIFIYYLTSAVIILVHCCSPVLFKKFLLSATILSLLILSTQFISHLQPYNDVAYLEGGNDPLTHESDARSVLFGPTWIDRLAGGEPKVVFYYQPLYRYFTAISHAILGDSLWAPYTVQLFLSTLTILTISILLTSLNGFPSAALFNFLTLAYWTITNTSTLQLATTTYQESLSLPFFILSIVGFIWLCYKTTVPSRMYLLLLGLLFGSALGIRTELIPALMLFIPLIFLLKKQFGWHQTSTLTPFVLTGFSLPFIFIMLRNVIVAGTWQILTSSAGVNIAKPFQDIIPLGSSISGSQLFTKIFSSYWSHPFKLSSIMIQQVHSTLMGNITPLSLEWVAYLAIALIALASIYLLIRQRLSDKISTILLLCAFGLPALSSTLLLQDNLLALRAHYSLLFIFSFSFILSRTFTQSRLSSILLNKE